MFFGSTIMFQQLLSQGFEVIHIATLPHVKAPIELQKYLDLSVQAILIGWDFQMTFHKQCYICYHVQHGIKLFGTSPDKVIGTGKYKTPGNGSIIATVQLCCQVKAETIGKPNTYVIDCIIKSNNLNRDECIMIGDSRQTDIAFGNNAGIATLCVLSGITSEKDIINSQTQGGNTIPMYYSKTIFE